MTNLWSLPYSVIVRRPDDTIFRLDSLLKERATGEWGWEFESSDAAIFRFANAVDAVIVMMVM